MKLKSILILGIVFIIVFFIYLTTLDKKVYYLDLGIRDNNDYTYADMVNDYFIEINKQEKYINYFTSKDYRTTDLIRDVEDNKMVLQDNKKQTIKNALIKADLVTLNIGSNDLYYKLNSDVDSEEEIYNYIDEILTDLEDLFEYLREYCKEDIIFIGLHNKYDNKYIDFFEYINEKITKMCDENDIYFINPNNILEKEDYSDIYTESGNKKIYNEIKNIIDKNILK